MKDITLHITRRRQCIEIATFAVCFVVAFALNAVAIAIYHSPWLELLTSLLYVLTLTVILYVAWSIVRVVVRLIIVLAKRLNKRG